MAGQAILNGKISEAKKSVRGAVNHASAAGKSPQNRFQSRKNLRRSWLMRAGLTP
jgi:hypothetical protein